MGRSIWLLRAAASCVFVFVGCQGATQSAVPKVGAGALVSSPAVSTTKPTVERPVVAAAQQPAVPSQVAPKESAAVSQSTVPPKVTPAAAPKKEAGPQTRTAFYRADAKPASIPPVLLSKQEEAICRIKVGDKFPAMSLPTLAGGGEKKLADLYGKKGTVVVFWKSDRRMALQQLADLGPEVVEPFGDKGIAVVAIAVQEDAASAKSAIEKAGANLPNVLLDADGKAFVNVDGGRLPRTYLLDPSGKVLWFDIEYSLATRRELHQALRAVTGKPVSGDAGRR